MNNEQRRRREAYLARKRRKKRQRTIQILKRVAVSCAAILLILFVLTKIVKHDEAPQAVQAQKSTSTVEKTETEIKTETKKEESKKKPEFQQKVIEDEPDFEVNLLTPNQYSRPQTALKEVRGIVIHYTANPGTTAKQNRSYFESLKDTHQTKASSHFVIGIDGEIIQCIPSSEISYASNDRNEDTLSIECCHKDATGQFTQETYDSLVEMTAWLCGKFNLKVENVIRHYDVTGKECPIYYVKNEDAWERFKEDVQEYLDTYGEEPDESIDATENKK